MESYKDLGDVLLKWGDIIVKKTEDYIKIGKLMIEIKKIEYDIRKIERKIGYHVIERIEKGSQTIKAQDATIQENINRYKECRTAIESRRKEIDAVRNPEGGE